MKKLIGFILFLGLFISCEGPMGPPGIDGEAPYSFSQVYTVHFKDLEVDSDPTGSYYYYEFKEPKLTSYIFDNGVMQAFLYHEKYNEDTMSPLPYSDFIVDSNGYKWEENISVDFQPGYIMFIFKVDDHILEGLAFKSYDFRVRFLW